ncbi:Cell division trigger factor [hydrothermal vent metagenome]|uniref:peptidylprolyl isomerase n=1 Tax=hydrothermal vent metagenome TaxID=652676 RepID=A0A1W1CL36_9ZZZZ
MKVTVNKLDDANTLVSGALDKTAIEANINKLAKQAVKEIKVDGFRAGKTPISVIKKMHGEKLTQDAEGEVLNELIETGIKEAGINTADLLGQPTFKKYKKTDEGIEVEIEISTRPSFDLEGYKDIVPAFEKSEASQEDIDAKLAEMAKEQPNYVSIETARAVEDGDMVLMNFEGFIGDEAFEGGKAENFNLKIGSNQFIPGFEEQIIGMQYAEQKDVVVTFPEGYASTDLAGKEATFKVLLHEIQEEGEVKIDDALAQKILNDEKATVETLTEKVKAQVEQEALSKVYNETLKPQMVEALVEKFAMALPNNIIEQEIDAKINAQAKEMSEEELASYKDNEEKLTTLRESVREDAVNSVKATFIVDALAKEENITVEDKEVSQRLYYEAMVSGQNAEEVIKYYEENNLLPAVKMGIIEDKLFGKLLGLEG